MVTIYQINIAKTPFLQCIHKPPSSHTPIFMGFTSFYRGAPVWVPKNEIMVDYSIISIKKTLLQGNHGNINQGKIILMR